MMNKEMAISILRGDVLGTNEQTHEAVYMAIKALKAEPVRHGKWMHNGFMEVKCCNCGNVFHELEDTNYCPHCGYKMDLDEAKE